MNVNLINALTIDVEDYFQVTAFDAHVRRDDWPNYPSRVVANTRRLLAIFAQHQVHATFFVLGWVAEQFPDLVREIASGGHEIGSHSYWHRLIYSQTPDEFREDLRRSKQVLDDILGFPVISFRAPTFSITPRSRWALEILVEEGFTIDSSLFPVRGHDRYGMPGTQPGIHEINTPSGSLWEAPLSTARFLGLKIPASGGGYFRLYPYGLTQRLFHQVHQSGRPVIFYLHPWEIDPQQPRVPGISQRTRFRHYVNQEFAEPRLIRLLKDFQFVPLGNLCQSQGDPITMAKRGITPLTALGAN